MTIPINIIFRERLVEAIDAYSGSFIGLCNRAGYSTSYVRRVLNGNRINPTLSFLDCMAGALNINPLELLKADQIKQRDENANR